MNIAFFTFVLFMAIALWVSFNRYLGSHESRWAKSVLIVWLSYTGLIGLSGLAGRTDLVPPGPLLLVGPPLLFALLALGRLKPGLILSSAIPLTVLTTAQAFRIVVELFLHSLWLEGWAPRMLTWEGANFDIAVGLTAPLIAWMFGRGIIGPKALWIWNVLGVILLANIALRALLTAPGPLNLIHTTPPNLVISTFPYTYIPGFLAPLALMLHVLSFRAINRTRQS